MALFTADTHFVVYMNARTDDTWLFSERRLYVDWIDERPLS